MPEMKNEINCLKRSKEGTCARCNLIHLCPDVETEIRESENGDDAILERYIELSASLPA